MTACAGDNLCELKIEKGADVIGTLNFILRVELDPLAGGDPSESFVYNLSVQIAQAVADQYDSNNVIFDAAPTAGHGVGYAVTSEGVKNALDALSLEDLADVTYTGAPVNGEAVVWDGTKWTNGTVSTVGSLDDLNDVDTTGKGNDYSLVYNSNDAEWQAKKLTEEVTQAEYDQLKLDGDLVEGVHYVITDGQDVTCNLGDLNDVDTSGASTGDILVKGANGWDSGNLPQTTPTITGNTTYTNSFAVNCYTYGKIVYAQVQSIVPKVALTDEEEMGSGFPIPISTDVRVALTDRKTGLTYRTIINSSGALKNWYNQNAIPTTAELFGTIVYISQ